jgi:hypothetical protein
MSWRAMSMPASARRASGSAANAWRTSAPMSEGDAVGRLGGAERVGARLEIDLAEARCQRLRHEPAAPRLSFSK